MEMDRRRISTSELKARASRIVTDVSRGKTTVIITKRGRPVAKLVPIDAGSPTLFGFAKGCIKVRGDIMEPVGTSWEASG